MPISLDDQDFLDAVASANIGDTVEGLEVEYAETTYAHFPFHSRVFPPGKILRKPDENIRVYVPYNLIGMTPTNLDPNSYTEHQTGDPDRGIARREVQ